MSNTPKQSPLGINVLGSLLQNTGLTINSGVSGYIGTTTGLTNYTPGSIVNNTLLSTITTALDLALSKIGADVTATTFNNMLNIGAGVVSALANGVPSTYTRTISITATTAATNELSCTSTENLDVGSVVIFTGVGFGNIVPNTLYWVNSVTSTTTFTISASNGGAIFALTTATGSLTLINFELYRWGFLKTLALQAWNEWNYNGGQSSYSEFLASYMTANGFIEQLNPTIIAVKNSATFLDGAYSNMNDLITGDIAGVTLSTTLFGQDLITLGRAIDLSSINTFGLPSNLLKILNKNGAVTRALTLAAISAGFTVDEWSRLLSNPDSATTEQQRKLWGTYNVILGTDLTDITTQLNCKTKGLESLADLLNPKKIFPRSYETLTVPIYNTSVMPTNSKTYYPIYKDGGVNQALWNNTVVEAVGTIIPPNMPVPDTTATPISSTTNTALSTLRSSQTESMKTGVPVSIPSTSTITTSSSVIAAMNAAAIASGSAGSAVSSNVAIIRGVNIK